MVERPIEKSLWHTLSTLPKGRNLVNEITRIFESRVDFRKLRKGDSITLALDEEIADGLVQETETHETMGKFVRIKHSDGYETEYLHMSRFEKGIVQGAPVRQGQVIGHVGATGIATGPHVELRLKKNGRFVDFSKEQFRYASFLPSPPLDCFQERVELFKESMDNGSDENISNFVFTCASEKESGSI